jgi:hypothetical protein
MLFDTKSNIVVQAHMLDGTTANKSYRSRIIPALGNIVILQGQHYRVVQVINKIYEDDDNTVHIRIKEYIPKSRIDKVHKTDCQRPRETHRADRSAKG